MKPHLIHRGALLALAVTALLALPPSGATGQEGGPLGTPSAFPGMVEVPGGEFTMGIDLRDLERMYRRGSVERRWHPKLAGADGEFLWWLLKTETPEHEATTEPFAMGRYCVTNAQYEAFLKDTSQTTKWITGNRRSIMDLGVEVFGENVKEEVLAQIYWLNSERLDQLKARVYEDNAPLVKATLDAFNVGRRNPLTDFDELPDSERVPAWVKFTLPEDTALVLYTREIPRHWPKGAVTEEMAAWPVVWVSAESADAFAEWAGMHVPTEKEWEKAARGPKGWLWPWGDSWDPEKERNLLIWLGTETQVNRGPAPDTKDHPIAVDSLPEGQSAYGCYHMLGNVYQWTSSSPALYPKSEAEPAVFFGDPEYRVLRGASYGTGMTSEEKGELLIRNTTRILAKAENLPWKDGDKYEAVGFRCAKYPTPARDVVAHTLARLTLPDENPDRGLAFDASRAYGVERNSYVPEGQAGPGKVLVDGPTRVVGFLPLEKLPYSTTKHVIAAQADRDKDDPRVLLGVLVWNADLTLEVDELVTEKSVPEPVEEPAPEDGEEGEGGEDEAAPEEAEAGDEPPAAPEGPVAPAPAAASKVVERRGWLPPFTQYACFVGLEKGRFVLLQSRVQGLKEIAYLPVIDEEADAKPLSTRLVKTSGKEISRTAKIDPATGVVTFSLAIPTGSSMSSDVFALTLRLRVKGKLDGDWRETTE